MGLRGRKEGGRSTCLCLKQSWPLQTETPGAGKALPSGATVVTDRTSRASSAAVAGKHTLTTLLRWTPSHGTFPVPDQSATTQDPEAPDTAGTLSAPWWQMAAKARGPPPSLRAQVSERTAAPKVDVILPKSLGSLSIPPWGLNKSQHPGFPLPPGFLSSSLPMWPAPRSATSVPLYMEG